MPKVKPLTENERRNKTIKAQLIGLMKVEGLTAQNMADRLGISLNTFYRHRDNPEKLALREQRILIETFPELVIE